jgi:hypothetical protein
MDDWIQHFMWGKFIKKSQMNGFLPLAQNVEVTRLALLHLAPPKDRQYTLISSVDELVFTYPLYNVCLQEH